MAEEPGQGRGRRPGQDAQDELAATEVRPDLAPDLAEHLRLDPEQDDVGALDGLDVRGDRADAVFALEVLAPLRARVAGDDLLGSTSLPRSRPAIIASAMTPEPTVAIVDFARGDIARSIAAEGGSAGRAGRDSPWRPRSGRTGPVVVTLGVARSRPGASAASSSAGLVVDLDDRELAAVVEAADGQVVGRASGGRRRSTAGRAANR